MFPSFLASYFQNSVVLIKDPSGTHREPIGSPSIKHRFLYSEIAIIIIATGGPTMRLKTDWPRLLQISGRVVSSEKQLHKSYISNLRTERGGWRIHSDRTLSEMPRGHSLEGSSRASRRADPDFQFPPTLTKSLASKSIGNQNIHTYKYTRWWK